MEQAAAATTATPSTEAPAVESSEAEALSTESTENESGTQEGTEVSKVPLFKRKVNGKLVEVSEDELWKHYGLETSARERLEEAAKARKEADDIKKLATQDKDQLAAFLTSLQTKPELAFELLGKMGHDAKKIAREMVLKEMEFERLSPEQKRLKQLEDENLSYQDKLKAIEEHNKIEADKQTNALFVKSVDENLAEALKLSGLTPKPKTVARMAEACQTLLDASDTGELPSPDQVVKKFLAYMRQDASDLIGEQPPEKLMELGVITEKTLKALVDWQLKRNKSKLPNFGTSSSKEEASTPKKEPKKKLSVNQFFDNL